MMKKKLFISMTRLEIFNIDKLFMTNFLVQAGLGVETQMVRRENVLRCKMYRDNKKIELKNSEKELNDLEIKHKQLKAREDFLDKSIEALHKFYINLINRNSLECPCEDGI